MMNRVGDPAEPWQCVTIQETFVEESLAAGIKRIASPPVIRR